ncbi:hypothetical protein BZA70DRAFT_271104 [Myxozyma melibiosi]|uniref:Hap4 transcription factor heteromerisation domain-containing protein n=1 Tax=Myxozyma melibiosi TaxID=54550 RepID=A0ABR1FBY2_9ASCO
MRMDELPSSAAKRQQPAPVKLVRAQSSSTPQPRHTLSRQPSKASLSTPKTSTPSSVDKRPTVNSHNTISYLPSTVTTRSPRIAGSSPVPPRSSKADSTPQPSSGKKVFYASSQKISPAPALVPASANRQKSSLSTLNTKSTSRLRPSPVLSASAATPSSTTNKPPLPNLSRKSYSSLKNPHGSSSSKVSAAPVPPMPTQTSKFVYANGKEEVLSPRRPPSSSTSSATVSTSTVHSPFYPVNSPPLSSSSFSSGFSAGTGSDEIEDDVTILPHVPSIIAQITPHLPEGISNTSDDNVELEVVEEDIDDLDFNNDEPTDAARVNRKILDLEISNTSLLSINRTLEREMHTQNRELRALRRWIQRNGSAGAPINFDQLSISDSYDEDENQEDSDTDEDDDDATLPKSKKSSSMAPLTERIKYQQEVFQTTQAINSSISKCIASSDFLIKEARGALEFTVTENEMRGRVLSYTDSPAYEEDVAVDETDDPEDQSDPASIDIPAEESEPS